MQGGGGVPGFGAARHALGLLDVHRGCSGTHRVGRAHSTARAGGDRPGRDLFRPGRDRAAPRAPVRGRLLPPSAGCGHCGAATAGGRAGLRLVLQKQGFTSVRQANRQTKTAVKEASQNCARKGQTPCG